MSEPSVASPAVVTVTARLSPQPALKADTGAGGCPNRYIGSVSCQKVRGTKWDSSDPAPRGSEQKVLSAVCPPRGEANVAVGGRKSLNIRGRGSFLVPPKLAHSNLWVGRKKMYSY